MRSLVVLIDSVGEAQRRAEFDRSPVRIGRGAGNDLRLPLGFVSDRHAQVDFDDRTATYTDLGSTNGTFVEGNRLEPRVPIAVENRLAVELGSIRLEFRLIERQQRQGLESGREAPSLQGDQTFANPSPPEDDAGEFPLITPPEQVVEWQGRAPRIAASAEPASELRGGSLVSGLPSIFVGDAPAAEAAAVPRNPAPEPPPAPVLPARPVAERAVNVGNLPVVPLPPSRNWSPPGRESALSSAPLPEARPPEDRAETESLRRLSLAFCDELIRLRKAYEVLGREMGIRTFTQSERSRLHEVRDAAEMLRHLTAPGGDPQRELRAVFGDMGTHHLAMLSALSEGARATLAHVDPENFRTGRRSLLGRSQNRWEEFAEHFRAFREDETAIQGTLFGPEFAEAYAAAKRR